MTDDKSHFQVFYADADQYADPEQASNVAVFSTKPGAEAFIEAWEEEHPDGSAHDLQEFDGPIFD